MERCRAAGFAKFAVMCRLKFVRLWTKAVIEVSILRASGIEEARPAGSHSGGPTFFLQARSRRDRAAGPKAGNGEKARRKELGEGAGDKSWPNDSWGSWQRGRGAAGDAPQATACCRMLPHAAASAGRPVQESRRRLPAGGSKDAGSFPGKPCHPPDGVLAKAPALDSWRLVHEAKGIGNQFFAG